MKWIFRTGKLFLSSIFCAFNWFLKAQIQNISFFHYIKQVTYELGRCISVATVCIRDKNLVF